MASPDKTPLEGMRKRVEAARRRGTFTTLSYDELDSLLAVVVRLQQERDEARENADGMARAPYGEYQKMRDDRDAALALVVRLRESWMGDLMERGFAEFEAREVVEAALVVSPDKPPEPDDEWKLTYETIDFAPIWSRDDFIRRAKAEGWAVGGEQE